MGNLRFKISKFTVFALFYFVLEGNFPSTSPRGAYIWGGDLTEGSLRYRIWGGYIWKGLYMEGLIFVILRYDVNGNLHSKLAGIFSKW